MKKEDLLEAVGRIGEDLIEASENIDGKVVTGEEQAAAADAAEDKVIVLQTGDSDRQGSAGGVRKGRWIKIALPVAAGLAIGVFGLSMAMHMSARHDAAMTFETAEETYAGAAYDAEEGAAAEETTTAALAMEEPAGAVPEEAWYHEEAADGGEAAPAAGTVEETAAPSVMATEPPVEKADSENAQGGMPPVSAVRQEGQIVSALLPEGWVFSEETEALPSAALPADRIIRTGAAEEGKEPALVIREDSGSLSGWREQTDAGAYGSPVMSFTAGGHTWYGGKDAVAAEIGGRLCVVTFENGADPGDAEVREILAGLDWK